MTKSSNEVAKNDQAQAVDLKKTQSGRVDKRKRDVTINKRQQGPNEPIDPNKTHQSNENESHEVAPAQPDLSKEEIKKRRDSHQAGGEAQASNDLMIDIPPENPERPKKKLRKSQRTNLEMIHLFSMIYYK